MQIAFEVPSSPENYYHAICDYFLPYFSFFRSKDLLNSEVTVAITTPKPAEFLLFSKIINTLVPKHSLIFSEEATPDSRVICRMARGLSYRRTITQLAKHIDDNLDLHYEPNTVVLISRRSAPRANSIADGRPHIRTIENNDELASQVERLCHAEGVEFLNVHNEDMTFPEQLRIYRRAKYVIGQHGAGLTNLIWMQRATHCFEIQCSSRLPFFRQIARAKRIRYHEVTPASSTSSIPVAKMLENEKGRDEIATVDIADILKPLSKLLVS